MPFIKSNISCKITDEQEIELKKRFGKAIALIPGKSEEYLLLQFEDNCRMWLRGECDKPTAYIEAAIFGSESHVGYDDFTAQITEAFRDVLGIQKDRIYLRFEDIPAWSASGQFIDRRMFR